MMSISFTHWQLHIIESVISKLVTHFLEVVIILFHNNCDQALDLLVSISYEHYCSSTLDLSTLSSTRGLTIL